MNEPDRKWTYENMCDPKMHESMFSNMTENYMIVGFFAICGYLKGERMRAWGSEY